MNKKELVWKFEVFDLPNAMYPVYAGCVSFVLANCYFTRPLYDEKVEIEVIGETSETGEQEAKGEARG